MELIRMTQYIYTYVVHIVYCYFDNIEVEQDGMFLYDFRLPPWYEIFALLECYAAYIGSYLLTR